MRLPLAVGAVTASVLAFGAVAFGTMTAADATPPGQAVRKAQETAERSAAAEGSLRRLHNRISEDATGHGKSRARFVVEAASAFRLLEFPSVPTDWVAEGLDLSKATREGDRLVQVLPNGGKVTFTIDPEIQSFLLSMMRNVNVANGSVVLIEPKTGRVIAKASHSTGDPRFTNLALRATPPSASVFKVITAAALMEGVNHDPEEEVCYHGGLRSLTERNITGDPRYDNRCGNLQGGLVWSLNSLMAKLAYQKLTQDDLMQWAENFGYNQQIPFELPVEVSRANIMEEPFERARAAAGFWHTHLSPLHGALIGAAMANDGVMMQPTIIEKYESPQGDVLYTFEPREFRRVMKPETAKRLSEMMVQTTTQGTARRYFGQRREFPRDIEVTGKTGTLSFQNPFVRFTWFVGHARHKGWDDAGIAVGGAMGNGETWHILGPFATSEAVRKYYEVQRARRAAESREVATR
jgi:penicillin-binding protein A